MLTFTRELALQRILELQAQAETARLAGNRARAKLLRRRSLRPVTREALPGRPLWPAGARHASARGVV